MTALFALTLLAAFDVQTLSGHPFSIDNFDERRGTAFVFLSSRCPESLEALPALNETYEKYRFRDILFVGIFPENGESEEEIRRFCQYNGVRFPFYRDRNGAMAAELNVGSSPEAFLVNDAGELVYAGNFTSETASDSFDDAIGAHLRGQDLPPTPTSAAGCPWPPDLPPMPINDKFGRIQFESELIFDNIPLAPAHHCSTITQAPNGDLLCLWYGGSYESADDQKLFLSKRGKDGAAWSTPEVIVEGSPLHPPGNAVIFRTNEDRVGILWGRMDASRPIRRGAGWSDCMLMYRYSEDNGETWSADRELTEFYGMLPRNLPIALENGEVAVPMTAGGHAAGVLLITDDGGDTWRASGAIDKGSQPTVVRRDDGSLLALLRSNPKVLKSVSTDSGASWSPAEPTELNCPGSGVAMTKLKSGRILVVHNDSPSERTPLSMHWSDDGGETWEGPMVLEANPGEYSYPCVMQTEDGTIHVTYTFRRYTIKHVQINEDWLIRTERPN
jgi:predicted neuraminidase